MMGVDCVRLALAAALVLGADVAEAQDSPQPEQESERGSETAFGLEREANHLILGGGLSQINDWREGDWGHGVGPMATFELVVLPVAIELSVAVALGEEDPILLADISAKLVLENESRFQPFIGVGPALTLDLEAGQVSPAAGGLFTVGFHDWLWDDLGFMADFVYKVLGGPELIHQASINIAFIGRLFL